MTGLTHRTLDRLRASPGIRRFLFVFLVATILVVGSERVFWYWTPSVRAHPEVALFYAFPAAGLLWLIDRYRVNGWWSLLLATPVFGYLVEGVLTPVLYEGGPLVPFFPAYFAFWHGMLSAFTLVFVIRRLLLENARARLLALATGLGAFWGTWAITSLLPEVLDDPELIADSGEALRILAPGEFAIYTLTFTAVLAGAHWLLGRGLWMRRFTPSRIASLVYAGIVAAVVIGWTISIPWAAPMFAGYVGIQVWALRRHRRQPEEPRLLSRLSGPVAARSLLPLGAMPVAAAVVYSLWWHLDPGESIIRGIYGSTFAVHALVGLAVTAAAIVKSLRAGRRAAAPESAPIA